MAETFPLAEPKKPQGSSKIEKREIITGGYSSHKEESMKIPIKQWKDDSTLEESRNENKPKSLDLSGRGLRTLHELDLYNLRVVELNLSNNPLDSNVLEYLPWNCFKKLDLSGCGLDDFCGGPIGYGRNLEELNLSNNSFMPGFDFHWLSHLPNLKKLDLSVCGLLQLRVGLIRYGHKLEELNLSNNPFMSEFELLGLSSLPNLKKLDLSGCGLTELPSSLKRYWNVQELNLSNNLMGHLDLLEKLKSENKPEEPVNALSIMQLPKLTKVVFEDAVYAKIKGVWTVERREVIDVSYTSNSESAKQSKQKQKIAKTSSFPKRHEKEIFDPSTGEKDVPHKKMLLDDSDEEMSSQRGFEFFSFRSLNERFEEHDSFVDYCWHCQFTEDELDDKIYSEFYQMKKIKKKLTIENYCSILFSLKIAVCVLCGQYARYKLRRQVKLNCVRWLQIVNRELLRIEPLVCHPSLKMPSLVRESITYLKNGVVLLFKWLSGLTNTEESHQSQRQNISRAFETAFEKASENFFCKSSTVDKVLVSKLRIISKILESFSKPEVAALGCLQLLQELHDLREIRERFRIPRLRMLFSVDAASVHEINEILFEFVREFLKPQLTTEEWPVTIARDGEIHNPLTQSSFFQSRLFDVSFPQELEILQSFISQQVSQDRRANDAKDRVLVTSSYEQTGVKSITVDQQGGCFNVPVASAFLVFPPDAVQGNVTLRCSRVKRKECEVKLKDGEAIVSRIFKIEPEGTVFRKPVTVLLSHSAYEDQDFLDFYELVVENLSPIDREELKTESISRMNDVPKEIHNHEILNDYLPFAKATIYETCTLVATTQVRAHHILVPTNKSLVFSKKYGENKKIKITFPAGVTKKILCLTVQLFPADDVLSGDIYLDDNLVCAPVIKVSGQSEPFLKPVDVEFTYSHNDVAKIEDNFLSIGEKIRFTTGFGLLLRSQKQTESTSNWLKLNESDDVYIERLRKDQIKFSFSVDHFCKVLPVVKKNADAQLNVDKSSSNVSQSRYAAIVLAVHDTGSIPKRIHAVLAPLTARKDVKDKWKVDGVRFGHRLKCEERIFFCVPLTDSLDNYHLPLKDYSLWFDPEMEFELANNVKDSVDLRGRFMHFLNNRPCDGTGGNHNTQGDCRAKAPIHTSDADSSQATTERREELTLENESQHVSKNSSGQREVWKNNIQRRQVLTDVLRRCEAFERMIEAFAKEKLKIESAFVTDPKGGKATKVVNIAGPLTTVVCALSCGALIVAGVPTFGVAAFVGAAVAGVTLAVTSADKHFKKSHAKVVDDLVNNVTDYLNCIVKEVAKELSHIFEYQLFQLKNKREVEVLASCAVNLMLDLEKNDKFDRNTLLKKVLRDGKITKKKLMTRNEDKWYAPDVFRKPGLRRMDIGTDRGELKYFVKPENACDTQTYGYRGQFLEVKKYGVQSEEDAMEVETPKFEELCEDCSAFRENCSDGTYFVESSIDREYTKQCSEALFYRPLHVLVRCPTVLASFIENHETEPSLADFLNTVIGFHDDNVLHPVYRPHSPGKVPHLSKADLSGADFSRSDFTDVSLEECDFTKCVMLFTELQGAKMSCSTFVDTLISHSNLVNIRADGCQWTKTSVLYSRVDSAYLDSVEPSVGGNCWDGTNLSDAITRKKRPFGCNGRRHGMGERSNPKRSYTVSTYS